MSLFLADLLHAKENVLAVSLVRDVDKLAVDKVLHKCTLLVIFEGAHSFRG